MKVKTHEVIKLIASLKELPLEDRKEIAAELKASGDFRIPYKTMKEAMALSCLAAYLEEDVDCVHCEDDPFLDPCTECGKAPTR